jgi:hypothetical protein
VAVTPNYSIPYPALTDAPNGPAQMQALAAQVDAVVARKPPAPVAAVWQNGVSDIVLSTSVHSPLLVVSVADPGYPYTLDVSACVAVIQGSSWAGPALPSIDVLASLTSATGTVISGSQGSGYYVSAGAGYNAVLPNAPSGTLTGSQAVYLSAENLNTAGGTMTCQFASLAGKKSWLYVKVVPV